MRAYRVAVAAFAVVFVALGLTITVLTAVRGGGLGLLLGPLFVALGAGRLYLLRARARADESDRDTPSADGR